MKPHLTQAAFNAAAARLNVEVATIMAVAEVESPRAGFTAGDRPTILFEAHQFSSRTGHRYDKSHPRISSRKWNRKLYTSSVDKEYLRLEDAVALNRDAALMSTSWGRYQLMGFNYAICGHATLQSFINAMWRSEDDQLLGFINYVEHRSLADELQRHDWHGFAHGYNGARYAEQDYHGKLARAYAKYKRLFP